MKIRKLTFDDLHNLELSILDKPKKPWFEDDLGTNITKIVTLLCSIILLPIAKIRWDHSLDAEVSLFDSILYVLLGSLVYGLILWLIILLIVKFPNWRKLLDSPTEYMVEQWAFAVGFMLGLLLFGTNIEHIFLPILSGLVFNSLFRLDWKAKLGIFTSLLIFYSIEGISEFIFIVADWDVVFANRGTLFVGITINSGIVSPNIENESWRLWPSVVLLYIIITAAFATTKISPKNFYSSYTLFNIFCLLFVWYPVERNYNPNETLLKLSIISLFGAIFYYFTHRYVKKVEEYIVNRIRFYLVLTTVLLFFMTIMILDPPEFLINSGIAKPGLNPGQWGGLYVNLILISAALVMGFSLAVLLAFGRRSDQLFISIPSTFIIEFVRSGPMVAWLFIALFILPDILEPFYDIDVVMSSIFAFTIFGACYISEVLRGGLQDVRTGQKEAATALGLSSTQIKLYVELPSAIRTTIPAIVSIFIGLWKDTTLLYLLGVLDFFYIARILPNTEFRFGDNYIEPLLFAATLFWLFAFILSRISLKIEEGLGLVREGGGEMT